MKAHRGSGTKGDRKMRLTAEWVKVLAAARRCWGWTYTPSPVNDAPPINECLEFV
jgi:hypothetical protein